MAEENVELLVVRDLHAGYGQTRVLKGVNLSVRAGELLVLIGPNGHGKTTLLRTISGLIRPSAGEITFDGRRIDGEHPERIATSGLVHIPQGDLPFADMTVEENLVLGAFERDAWRSKSKSLERVYGILPLLAERRSNRARTLSGGERRMLALGRGLMRQARLLMVDEPSLGLAPVIVNEVYRHIEQIVASGMTLLLVEENFSHVQTFDANVLLLESGRVIREGSVGELLGDEIVMATYMGT
jgi:branched-chain amino acid transport system ATP-binding protein